MNFKRPVGVSELVPSGDDQGFLFRLVFKGQSTVIYPSFLPFFFLFPFLSSFLCVLNMYIARIFRGILVTRLDVAVRLGADFFMTRGFLCLVDLEKFSSLVSSVMILL